MRACSSGKAQHTTVQRAYASAHEFARQLNRDGILARSLYGYRCPECRAWHVTKRAEWDGQPNRPLYRAAPESLQRWAMTGSLPVQNQG